MAPRKMTIEISKYRNLTVTEPASCVRVQIIDRVDGRVVHTLYDIQFAPTSDSGAYMVRLFEAGATEIVWVGPPDARFDVYQLGIDDDDYVSKLWRLREDNKHARCLGKPTRQLSPSRK